ncbi:MAG: glycosyltransferase, partial [Bacteroidales bacterium]|nr:glycosyltransferase [Bacteroidales bacterium]
MRVLMFGWEFPPHIAGGLGTASYGLTRGLAAQKDVEVTFVVPKAYGDEDQSIVRLIGANTIPVAFKKVKYNYFLKPVEKIEVFSKLVPYTDPDDFWKMTRGEIAETDVLVETNQQGTVDFSGSYGASLMDEIHKYSVVAQVIASELEFDIIHAHDWLAYPAGIAAKAVSGKPLVIHVHATDFDRSGGNVNPVVYNMEKEGMDAADKIITVSNLTREIVITRYNIDPDKVETVYNAVEPLHHSELDIPERTYDDKIVT